MLWLVLWIVVLAMGAFGVMASANSLRFGRRVAQDARQMWTGAAEPHPIDRGWIEGLPTPVRRYADKAVGERQRAVRSVRLRHGGTFRPKLDGVWMPIRGDEYFAADPPGFVWWGRVRAAPGLWVDARDRSVGGVGSMLISAESTFTLAESAGPEMDQGALLRLLGEMPLLPTALLDPRYVTWTAVDDRRAGATLRVNGREAAGVFEFGDDGLPTSFLADRQRDLGGGRSVLTPWSGELADYREVDGMLAPHRMAASWHVDGKPIPYVRFLVETLEYDTTAPF